MRFRILSCLLIILIIFTVLSVPACGLPVNKQDKASAPDSKRQVVIIDLPRFDLAEVSNHYPNLLRLVQGSSAGIMSTPLAEQVTGDMVYLAFNSGSQLKTDEEANRFFNASENIQGFQAGRLYKTLTGFNVSPNNGVNLGLARLIQLNSSTIVKNIGLFGKILHKNDLKTGVIGNSDADILNRSSAMLLMDPKGIVDFSAAGPETTLKDPLFPYETRTDIEKVLAVYKDLKNKADVIVITLGDMERLERFSFYLNENRWRFYREQVLRNYDKLLGGLIAEIHANETSRRVSTLIMIFSPMPSARNTRDNTKLNPVLIAGPGFGSGILFSTSSRRTGIVTCYDLPATILNFLNIGTRSFSGHNLRSVPGKWTAINPELKNLVRNYVVRWPLLTGYGYLLIGLFLFAIFGLIFNYMNPWLYKALGFAYLFVLTIPAVFLIESAVNPLSWGAIAGWTLGLGGLGLFTAFYLGKKDFLKALSILSFVTVIMIVADGLLNGYFELKSFFGYSAVAGARFYGLGNEYMGFLIGAYIVFISINYEKLGKHRNQFLWLMVGLMAIFLAHPNFGANIGGGITALVGLGITVYLLSGHPVGIKEIGALAGALATLLLMVGFWEIYVSGSFITHFGQFLNLIKTNGFGAIGDLISRKWELNLRLIAYTSWTKILICILFAIPVLYKKPPAMAQKFLTEYPHIGRGFTGLAMAALIALIVNDSGIVSVATMFIFGGIMLLLAIFNLKNSASNLKGQSK